MGPGALWAQPKGVGMAQHRASVLEQNEDSTLTISFYWAPKRKQWDVVIRGKFSGGRWAITRSVDTRAQLDKAAAWLLMGAVEDELMSWIY